MIWFTRKVLRVSVIDSNIFSDWAYKLLDKHVRFRVTKPTFSFQKMDDVLISWLKLDTFRKAGPWKEYLKQKKRQVSM